MIVNRSKSIEQRRLNDIDDEQRATYCFLVVFGYGI